MSISQKGKIGVHVPACGSYGPDIEYYRDPKQNMIENVDIVVFGHARGYLFCWILVSRNLYKIGYEESSTGKK